MNILVIGNGFDLAHTLPTKYSHFLKFIEIIRDYGDYIALEKAIPKRDLFQENCFAFAQKINDPSNRDDRLYREISECSDKNNLLLNYYLKEYKKRCKSGQEGWIDFESEIARIIHIFDEARQNSKRLLNQGMRCLLSEKTIKEIAPFIVAETNGVIPMDALVGKSISPGFIERHAAKLYMDLEKITRLLEIYLDIIVQSQPIEKRIQAISSLVIDKVLSFNYTNTFQRLYDPEGKAEYCYIHGKVTEFQYNNSCNLVLGIDEFLDNERQNQDNAFVWFKKFYQRIFKETSSTYIDWLDQHEHNNPASPIDIYFYGHSLAETDKDILQRLILHKNAKSHIFYYKKEEMGKQITNLIKVIGKEPLIQMTRGKNRSITFEAVPETANA